MAGIEAHDAVVREGRGREVTSSKDQAAGSSIDRPMAGLDVLRFLAAVMVMVFHFGYWFSYGGEPVVAGNTSLAAGTWWGWIGVQIFFVISGFVIALSAEHRSVQAFMRSRVLRLLPGLMVFAVLSFVVLVTYEGVPLSDGLILLRKSLVLFPKGPWVDGVYWSLTVEVVFYAGIALLLAFKAFDRLQDIVKICAVLSLFLAFAILAADAGYVSQSAQQALASVRDDYWSRFALISTGPYFITGLALYFLHRYGLRWDWLAVLGAAVVASEVQIYYWAVREMPQMALESQAAVPGVIFALAVVLLVAIALWQDTHSQLSPPLRAFARTLGLASYPLYLVHFVTGRMVYSWLIGYGVSQLAAMVVAMGLCVVISFVFAIYAEPLVRQRLALIYDKAASFLDGRTGRRGARPGIAPAE